MSGQIGKDKKYWTLDGWLVAIIILATFLNIYGIWQKNYVNSYYTSAVFSMMQSFHNFFFAAFDPAGFVTVDKPPVAFWLQTISASLFGLHGWSVILPQALAGIGSVILIYVLLKPTFGQGAARIGALIMACTPVAVAVSRTNNVDSLLVFILLSATCLLFKGVKNRKWGWIVTAFAVVGLGFNTKMLEAYMILPAFYLYFFFAFREEIKKKIKVLVLATAALIFVSFSWAVAVDSIPAQDRPYIGSSQSNSVIDETFGYNGISRLTGGVGGSPRESGLFNTGTAGVLRLFSSQLSGQISWLLPFALMAGLSILSVKGRKITLQHEEVIFWLAWLIPVMGFFSIASFFHPYYLITLAPPIASLSGAGWSELLKFYQERSQGKRWLLPLVLLGNAIFEFYILWPYRSQIGLYWIIGAGIVGVVCFILLCLPGKKAFKTQVAAGGMFVVLLAAPLYWAATPLLYGGIDIMPEAGPQLKVSGSAAKTPGLLGEAVDHKLLSYVTEHNAGEQYLLAMDNSALTVAPYILQTGKAVMAMGGFSGTDPILTEEKLRELVADKKIRFFLLSSQSYAADNQEVVQWICKNGQEVPQAMWQSGTNTLRGGISKSARLYEINING